MRSAFGPKRPSMVEPGGIEPPCCIKIDTVETYRPRLPVGICPSGVHMNECRIKPDPSLESALVAPQFEDLVNLMRSGAVGLYVSSSKCFVLTLLGASNCLVICWAAIMASNPDRASQSASKMIHKLQSRQKPMPQGWMRVIVLHITALLFKVSG